jgi:hypothetical protein
MFITDILALGITAVHTLDGESVRDGKVLADKLRPARRGGKPVLFVERAGDYWVPLKVD